VPRIWKEERQRERKPGVLTSLLGPACWDVGLVLMSEKRKLNAERLTLCFPFLRSVSVLWGCYRKIPQTT
jgi:hypothetical protein